MSSDSKGRYQSKLFNFVDARSRQVAETCDRAFRHVKVASIWGIQLLLFPIYATFQTTRLAGKKLQNTVRKGFQQLQAGATSEDLDFPTDPNAGTPTQLPFADTPIQQVLSAVKTLSLPSSAIAAQLSLASADRLQGVSPQTDKKPLFTQQIAIQGLATVVATRSLVLVTQQNEILDILTLGQQQELYRHTIWELACYWRNRRLFEAANEQVTAQLPPVAARATLLPPVRMFRQLMAWVQRGPIAIAANLFHESRLVTHSSTPSDRGVPIAKNLPTLNLKLLQQVENPAYPHPKSPILELLPSGTFTVLDSKVAQLEAGNLPPLREIRTSLLQGSWSVLQRLQMWVNSAIVDPPEVTTEEVETGWRTLRGKEDEKPIPSWFFELDSDTVVAPTAQPQTQHGVPPLTQKSKAIASPPPLPYATPTPTAQRKKRHSKGSSRKQHRSLEWTSPLPPTAPAVAVADVTTPATLTVTAPNSHRPTLPALTPNPTAADCIEAKVTSVGYVKHPLEQALEWLDRIMLWLEANAIRLWRSLLGQKK